MSKKSARLVGAALLNDRLRGDDDAMAAADDVVDYLKNGLLRYVRKVEQIALEGNGGRGDKEALFYLIDRVMGRPKQHMDARIASVVWTPDDYRRLALEMAEDAKRMGMPVDRGCIVKLSEPVPVGEDD